VLSHFQYVGYEDRTPEFWPKDASNPLPKGDVVKNVGPKTQGFTFTAPVTQYGGFGIGFMNDRLGYERSTHIKLNLAGRYPLASGATVSAGVDINFLQKGLDGAQLEPLVNGDPKIPTGNVNDMHPVFGAGAYYIDPMLNSLNTRDLWVSASVLGLNKPNYVFQTGTTDIAFSTPTSHIYLMGGITMLNFMGDSRNEFLPSAMIKMNRGIVQADLTAMVRRDGKLWGGLAYRTTSDALSILLGYSGFNGSLSGLRVGYSYDLTLSRILNVSSGSHELQLNYCFKVVIPPPTEIIIITPPYMHRKSNY